MRDLRSRLREIVRTPLPDAGQASRPRELTYVPDVGAGGTSDPAAAAEALGGEVAGDAGRQFVVVDRRWDGAAWHGRQRVGSFAVPAKPPLALYDPRLSDDSDGLVRRPVFFDIETTGLAGGAGTMAFLAGCGWFDDDGGFHVRQFFLPGPTGESAMLEALADAFKEASLLVTYNGRTFDVPTMELRWAFHRQPSAAADVPHFDMLPPARRLWARPSISCTLTALERSQLGFHRIGDVPGFEIPVRYFHFLRTGDAQAMEGVLEHNRLDLLSLAAVTARALELAADGPDACREPGEQAALGRLYERAGEEARALRAYELAAAGDDDEVRADALARAAVLLRRAARYDEAAEAWRGVLEGADERRGLTPLQRMAIEALAIHHEHRARDLDTAHQYARRLAGSGARPDDVRHRLQRLERKLGVAEDTTGGQKAARLFEHDT